MNSITSPNLHRSILKSSDLTHLCEGKEVESQPAAYTKQLNLPCFQRSVVKGLIVSNISVRVTGFLTCFFSVQLYGTMRVVMEPLLGDMPLIGALSVFFLKKPVSSFQAVVFYLADDV